MTDLVKKKAGMDKGLAQEDYDTEALTQAIATHLPRFLAFTSKTAAQKFLGTPNVEYGPNDRTDGTKLWVLPSTSGTARRY